MSSQQCFGSSGRGREDHLHNDQGIALVAALVLMAVLSVIGATVLSATSTEIAISGNYRRGLEAFYLAEAGIAEGRARLRGDHHHNSELIVDPAIHYNPQWTAYILTSVNWEPTHDATFYTRQTNYFPISGYQANSIVRANSLQSKLSYWVKLKHKTEYDAEQDGHRSSASHYIDNDGSKRRHTRANPGNILYFGYPTPNATVPVEFTGNTLVNGSLPVERIIASASLRGGAATIEVDVVHPPAPHVLAAVYSLKDVSLTGPFNTISGDDWCGVKPSIPPIYVQSPSRTTGPASYQGSPSFPQEGPLEIHLLQAIMSLKKGATLVTTNSTGMTWGNASTPLTVHMKSSERPTVRTLRNVMGYGILLLEGDVTIRGPFQWQGLILSSGKVTMNGSTGHIHVRGGMWVDQLVDVGGALTVSYDSCAIKTAVLGKPLVVRKWKQLM